MSNFKFRLATLLQLRETTRDERGAELAEAHRTAETINKQMAYVGRELNSVQSQYRRAAGPGIVNLDRVAEAGQWEFSLRTRKEQLSQQLEAAEAEIEHRQREFADALRDVRVLEKLCKRQADQHRQDGARQETKQLDEAARQGFARKQSTQIT